MSNKKTFKVEIDGKDVMLAVVRPNSRTTQQANLVYAAEVRRCVDAGLYVRDQVEQIARERNLWDDERQKRYEELQKNLRYAELKLKKGGIKLSEARKTAIQMRRDRAEIQSMMVGRNNLDRHTAESHADQARFNYYVASCTVYSDSGKPYFKDVDDYLNREADPAVGLAAVEMGKLMYRLDDDFESKLPENEFLLKHNFVNKDLQYVRKDGKLIDADGDLIDEFGRRVNEAGELIDVDGNALTDDGEYKVEFVDFINDLEETPAKAA